jgi:hypothetical protein
MGRTSVLVLAVGVLIAGGAARVAWTASARPALRLESSTVDFGPLAERATKGVIVRNAGRAPLRILAVSSSCGCTTAVIDATILPPGGSAPLAITFDPVAHGPQPGPARHAVYVRTNDQRTPEAEIEVRAVVLKEPAR